MKAGLAVLLSLIILSTNFSVLNRKGQRLLVAGLFCMINLFLDNVGIVFFGVSFPIYK